MEGEEFNWVSQGWGGFADRHKHANLSKVNKGRTVTCTHSRPQQGFSNACCVLDTVLGLQTGPGFLLLEAGKVFKLIHEVECENGNQSSARAESDQGWKQGKAGQTGSCTSQTRGEMEGERDRGKRRTWYQISRNYVNTGAEHTKAMLCGQSTVSPAAQPRGYSRGDTGYLSPKRSSP